jgi:hypothetical protein
MTSTGAHRACHLSSPTAYASAALVIARFGYDHFHAAARVHPEAAADATR